MNSLHVSNETYDSDMQPNQELIPLFLSTRLFLVRLAIGCGNRPPNGSPSRTSKNDSRRGARVKLAKWRGESPRSDVTAINSGVAFRSRTQWLYKRKWRGRAATLLVKGGAQVAQPELALPTACARAARPPSPGRYAAPILSDTGSLLKNCTSPSSLGGDLLN